MDERDREEDDRTLPLGVPIDVSTPRRSRPRRSWPRRIVRWMLGVLVGYYLFCVLLLLAYQYIPPPTTGLRMQRRVEGLLDGRWYRVERHPVPLESLPRHVPRAVIAAEDGRFYDHGGFDWQEMRNARDEAVRGTRVRGASTITQQLMKNLFGTSHANPLRKLYDWGLTPVAEAVLGKERILELYLNEVEWGDGVWGIDAGARHHYGVAAEDLSRTQAAGLAALLPNPRTRTPGNTARYRGQILRRMSARGW